MTVKVRRCRSKTYSRPFAAGRRALPANRPHVTRSGARAPAPRGHRFTGGGCQAMTAKASASAASDAVWNTSAIRAPARVPADAGTSCGAIRKAHVLQYLPGAKDA